MWGIQKKISTGEWRYMQSANGVLIYYPAKAMAAAHVDQIIKDGTTHSFRIQVFRENDVRQYKD
jgi:hypothetical protein